MTEKIPKTQQDRLDQAFRILRRSQESSRVSPKKHIIRVKKVNKILGITQR